MSILYFIFTMAVIGAGTVVQSTSDFFSKFSQNLGQSFSTSTITHGIIR